MRGRGNPRVLRAACILALTIIGEAAVPNAAPAITMESHVVGGAGGSSSGVGLRMGCTSGLACIGSAGSLSLDQLLGFWRWGQTTPAGANDPAARVPVATALLPNHPNPFLGSTEFVIHLAGSEGSSNSVRLDVFDVSGRLVDSVLDAPLPPGVHRASWDGRNLHGQRVSAGVYFARFTAGSKSQTRPIVAGR